MQQKNPINRRLLGSFIPSPGNVLFTLFVVGITLWVQSVGAITGLAPATESTATTLDLENSPIPYQGYLTDEHGKPLDGDYEMVFRIYAQANGGAPVWTEQRNGSNKVTLTDGLFTVRLGSVNVIPRSMIVDNDEIYLGVTVGNNNELTPRLALNSMLDISSEARAYYFHDSFATPEEWVADLIFNENYQRYCEKIGKTFVSGETVKQHYNYGPTNGWFYKDWYYVGTRHHEADQLIYTRKPAEPDTPYAVWKYSGEDKCCVHNDNWTMTMSAIIWCK